MSTHKEGLLDISETILKYGLFIWRVIFWLTTAGVIILSIFNILPEKFSVIFFFICFFVLIGKAISRGYNLLLDMHRDLRAVKKKLGLKNSPDKKDPSASIEYVQRRAHGGYSYLKIREHYISVFGYRDWLTDGKDLTKHIFASDKLSEKGDPEKVEETQQELLTEEATIYDQYES